MTYDPSSILRSYVGLDFTSLSLYRDLLSRPSTKPKKKENHRWKTAQELDRLDEAIDLAAVWGVNFPSPLMSSANRPRLCILVVDT